MEPVVWADLRTDDLAAAKRFYAEVFGWSYAEWPDYTVAMVGQDAVAGLKKLTGYRPEPFWLTYLEVDDPDTAAARAAELHGRVHAPPFDTPAGRVCVIDDPAGATVCLRHSPGGIAACRFDDPGCLTGSELHTTDPLAAAGFYAGVLGRRIEGVTGSAATWIPHIAVESVADTLSRLAGAGGMVVGRADGRAVARDPRGAEFGVSPCPPG